jgi:hypothetical protein
MGNGSGHIAIVSKRGEKPSEQFSISNTSNLGRVNSKGSSINGSEGGLQHWVCRIQAACLLETNNILELARLMCTARRTLPHGGWSQLWQTMEIPFSKRKGEMLVVIGKGVEGLNANNYSHLPVAWRALYYLARLGSGTLKQLVEQGRVHPGLSLQQAKELLAEYLPESRRTISLSKLHVRLARFATFIQTNLKTWSQQERETATRGLAALIEKILTAGGETAAAGDAMVCANRAESIPQIL